MIFFGALTFFLSRVPQTDSFAIRISISSSLSLLQPSLRALPIDTFGLLVIELALSSNNCDSEEVPRHTISESSSSCGLSLAPMGSMMFVAPSHLSCVPQTDFLLSISSSFSPLQPPLLVLPIETFGFLSIALLLSSSKYEVNAFWASSISFCMGEGSIKLFKVESSDSPSTLSAALACICKVTSLETPLSLSIFCFFELEC
mmetsp:Transcript_23543/g.50381  ORF Transcript_23543/g.50381 Transcript_23543/m.50381 type:complete len:202 (-) Transcript_23543:530-1135(-)